MAQSHQSRNRLTVNNVTALGVRRQLERGTRRRIDCVLPRASRAPEMPALDRFRAGVATPADWQIVQARAARPLLGRSHKPHRVTRQRQRRPARQTAANGAPLPLIGRPGTAQNCPLRDLTGGLGAGRVGSEAAIRKRCSETAVRPQNSGFRPCVPRITPSAIVTVVTMVVIAGRGDRDDRVIVAVVDVLRCRRQVVVMVLVRPVRSHL